MKPRYTGWLMISSVLALSACATSPPTLSRPEYLAATNREYPNRTPEQVIAAAEEVLKLDDGDDVKIADNPTGFVATRNWVMYLVLTDVFGVDTWVANTQPMGNGTKVNVQVGTQTSALMPLAASNGSVYEMNGPTIANPVQGTAIYDVFWARLDYLLGLRPDWMSCDEANNRVSNKITWGDNAALCNSFNVKDQTPKASLFGDSSKN